MYLFYDRKPFIFLAPYSKMGLRPEVIMWYIR
jgi:hypothetical protein